MPLTIGTIHFTGIGGIGMSGIAEILHNLGYSVQGSDLSDNPNVKRLRDMGIAIEIGHREENIGDAQVVVISSAVNPDNPEVVAARAKLVPVVRRAEMLAELMRLKWAIAVGGTHGKTTTTSLISAMLDTAGYDPTVINGGIINAYGTNARLGATFIMLPATIAVVTNIDPEHMEFYGSFDKVKEAFRAFVENIPFYGFAVLCIDHPEVQALIGQVSDRRLVTYGFSPQAEIRAIDAGCSPDGCRFSVTVSRGEAERVIKNIRLPMYGEHNMLNSLAAMAVGVEMGIDDDVIVRGLSNFEGVKRRFTRTGEANGVTVIDDYGHHPVEITAVLKAARSATKGHVVAVVQPHRYTRLESLFEEFCACFNDADTVIVAHVHAAGEEPIPGIDRDALVEGLRNHGHRHVLPLDDEAELARLAAEQTEPGDMVVCLGAGTISAWANALPGRLAALDAGAEA
jgi:UDP-N-acetylmuramate--alanine ligase